MLAAGAWPASAQSIDPAGVAAVLGRPLDISVRVQAGTPGTAFGPECVRAAVSYGDQIVPAEQLRVRVSPGRSPDQYRVRVLSTLPVLEPLVNIRLTLTCGGEVSREFAIFADPPLDLPTTQAAPEKVGEPDPVAQPATDPQAEAEAQRRAEARRAARQARAQARAKARAAARAKAAQESAQTAAVAPAPAPAPAAVAAAAPPVAEAPPPVPAAPPPAAPASAVAASAAPLAAATPTPQPPSAPAAQDAAPGGVRLKLEPAELEALASTLLRISRQQGTGTGTGANTPPAGDADAAAASDASVSDSRLAQELAQLRDENRKALAAIASMQARLQESEEEQRQAWRQWWPLGLAFVMLPLMVWALRRGSAGSGTLDTASRGMSTMLDEEPVRAPTPSPEGDLSLAASAERNANSEPAFGMIDTTQPAAWARANVGTPSLAVEELEELNHEAHEMISRGYFGAAAALIEEHLQSREAKNPWLLMRLLDLYREMGQPWNYQRVASQLQTLFNVRVPGLDEIDRPGRTLERFATTLETLKLEWNNPGIVDTLRLLLLRPTYIEELDLGAFRELLLLYAIAHEKEVTADGLSAGAPVPASLYSDALNDNRRAPPGPSGSASAQA